VDPDHHIAQNIGDATFLPHRAFIADADLCIVPQPCKFVLCLIYTSSTDKFHLRALEALLKEAIAACG
jgi:hypothetical protein